MKYSAYLAASLPFVLLALLLASVIERPRRSAAVAVPPTLSATTTGVVGAVARADTRAPAAGADSAGAQAWRFVRSAADPMALLRMPYFSFARDFTPRGGQ